jgi:antitoxin (DNA-binding transcriptional repressor) of toxin-antitoxin stability system
MRQMDATAFKRKCLALLDNLDPEGILITKHGRAVARVIPASSDCAELIGSMKGKIRVRGRIHSTGIRWGAHSRRGGRVELSEFD